MAVSARTGSTEDDDEKRWFNKHSNDYYAVTILGSIIIPIIILLN